MDPQTEMGPSVDESQFKTVLEYIDIGREDGATLVCGGEPRDRQRPRQRLLRPADGLRSRHA